jgi:hypothetical protein
VPHLGAQTSNTDFGTQGPKNQVFGFWVIERSKVKTDLKFGLLVKV